MTDTEFKLPYADTFITARIPSDNIACVLEKREAEGIKNEPEAVTECLRHPIGSPPLSDCVKEGDRVAVIVPDNTRACPDDRLLPLILAELEKKVSPDDITIIIALGLHPPLDREAMIKKYGGKIVENYRVFNHDVNDCVHIGTTTRGTPIEIDRKVVEADFRISTGLIEPHFFAGFSGGRKIIAPGVFSVSAAYKNHSKKMLEHPLAKTGILEGNPVHEDMIEQARAAGLNFIVNVLLNKKGEITHVVSGDFIEAHEKGCEIEKELSGIRVSQEMDICVITNGGAPLDLDLYQSCKGMETAMHVTRKGGIIIMCSSCSEGAGPEEYVEMHRAFNSPKEVLASIGDEHPTGVQWQNQILANIQVKNTIYLVSELNDAIVKDMMMVPFHTFDEALEYAFKELGKDAKIAVIPEGPAVIPLVI